MSMGTDSAIHDCVQDATQKQIMRLREKLLDLSKRNPLISFRHSPTSRKQMRIIDELPDELFARIALAEDASMHFVELPDVDESIPLDEQNNEEFDKAVIEARLTDDLYLEQIANLNDDESAETTLSTIERVLKDRVRDRLGMPSLSEAPRLTNSEIARSNGIEPAYELPSTILEEEKAPKHTDNAIQTLLKRNEMDRRLGNLHSEVRTMQQEQGVNALYCMFGFVRWYESESSNVERLAPLLMLPTQMSRELKNGRYRYDIRSDGADTLEINRCFDEMLKRQFGQSLPKLEEDDTPEKYFQKASEQFTKNQPRWKIKRYVTVGILSFQRLKMYLDLDPHEWAEDLETNELVQDLLSGSETSQIGTEIDSSKHDVFEIPTSDPCLVADADGSQFSVVLDCLNNRNLAVEGPPGTGKSQTITNIISSALYEGKTVLFLAEKMAALDVVKNRLNDAGVGEFCLELHSTKVSKKALLSMPSAQN